MEGIYLEYITVLIFYMYPGIRIGYFSVQSLNTRLKHVFKPMSFVFYEWTRERKFTLHSEMKPGECSNANTRKCNGITNLPASNFKRAGRWLVMIVK